MAKKNWQISNANLVLPEGRQQGGCVIEKDRISSILKSNQVEDGIININLKGYTVFPGLVNGHDSLMATYYPFQNNGAPYHSWLGWDNAVKSADLFKERMLIDIPDLYRLGAYRNLMGGATTVVDHIPHFVRKNINVELPLYLLEDFGLSHSICSYSLNWGDGVRKEYEKAEKKNIPYITHIAEGLDRESRESLETLDEKNGLGEHTVLVHGISLSNDDLDRIAEVNASLVWCPDSNLKLYNKTLPVKEALERGINICLGTDSAMTGSLNLLNEIRVAAETYQNIYSDELSAKTLYEMVSSNSAKAFRLKDRGAIAIDQVADLMILKGDESDPYTLLLQSRPEDIYLLIQAGKPVFGDESTELIFNEMGIPFDKIIVNGTRKIIYGGIENLLRSIAEAVGFKRDFPFLQVD